MSEDEQRQELTGIRGGEPRPEADKSSVYRLADLLGKGHPASVIATIQFIEALLYGLTYFSADEEEEADWKRVAEYVTKVATTRAKVEDLLYQDQPEPVPSEWRPIHAETVNLLIESIDELRETILSRR